MLDQSGYVAEGTGENLFVARGNVIKTRSTVCEDIHLEVCSNCHPFYTGKQKVIDSAGRIDRFNKRFGRKS